MDKEITYEHIEAYLAGELPVGERERFEQQLAADRELARELELHRRLERVMSDREKLAFAKTSAEAAKEFQAPKPMSSRYPRRIIMILVILAALALWRMLQREKPAPEPATPPVEVIQDTAAAETPTPTAPEPVKDTTPPAPPKPARNPFAPNSILEKELSRPANAYAEMEAAILESYPGETAGTRQVKFAGRLLMVGDVPQMELVLLDNSLPEGKPVLRLPVEATLLDDANRIRAFAAKNTYTLEAAGETALPAGLYYGRLLAAGEPESLWTGKLRVQ